MAEGARVESIDAVKQFRIALWKFAEAATMALGDAESELNRTLVWLETEQQSFWQHQIRKRMEVLIRAKEALRQKQMFKDASGRTPTAVEEEKAVRAAQRRVEEANERYNNTRQWARRMHKELQNYKGGVQRFATAVAADVPAAAGHLDQLVAALDNYVALAAPNVDFASAPPPEAPSMARAPDEGPPAPAPVEGEQKESAEPGAEATPPDAPA